jgi:hypothetical protein
MLQFDGLGVLIGSHKGKKNLVFCGLATRRIQRVALRRNCEKPGVSFEWDRDDSLVSGYVGRLGVNVVDEPAHGITACVDLSLFRAEEKKSQRKKRRATSHTSTSSQFLVRA